jgi:hypothetical protein
VSGFTERLVQICENEFRACMFTHTILYCILLKLKKIELFGHTGQSWLPVYIKA